MAFNKPCPSCGIPINLGKLRSVYYAGGKKVPWYKPATPKYFCKSCETELQIREGGARTWTAIGILLVVMLATRYGMRLAFTSGLIEKSTEATLSSLLVGVVVISLNLVVHVFRDYTIVPKN